MPRDATGTYTLPLAPFVAGTLAKAGEVNSNLSDIAQALTDSQSRSTPSPALGDVNLNGHDILNLGQVQGDLIASGGVFANGLSSNFGFEFAGPNYVWLWGLADYFDWFNPAEGSRHWRAAGTDVMTLSAAGVLTTTGGINTPTLSVSGTLTTGGLSVSGTFTAGSLTAASANISGALTAGSITTATATVSGTLTAGEIVATDDITVTHDLGVNRDAFITGKLTVNGAVGFAGDASVGGILTATTVNVTDAMTVTSNIGCAGIIRGATLQAYRATGLGGFVGSFSGSAGSNVGFWNNNGLVYWGNADAVGVPNDFLRRMSLDTNSNLIVNNAVYSINEVHAGNKGIYYTGLDNDAHAIAFMYVPASSRVDVFVDKTRVGSITLGALREDEPAPVFEDLQAKIAALEARIVALGG